MRGILFNSSEPLQDGGASAQIATGVVAEGGKSTMTFVGTDKSLNRARKLKNRACSSRFDDSIKTGQALGFRGVWTGAATALIGRA
ncbi:MAG TPA: hypothetical protein VF459_09870 [Caulobacteraceae bacterium]